MNDDVKALSMQIYAALIVHHLGDFTYTTPEYCEEIDWESMAQLASKTAVEGALALTKRWQSLSRDDNNDDPT